VTRSITPEISVAGLRSGIAAFMGFEIHLLQRHKHLHCTLSFAQRLQCLPNNRSQHLASVCAFHRITGGCGSYQQITYLNRPILCADLARNDSYHRQRNLVVGRSLASGAG
jgi:hypothetical protein